jgi:Uma2 family endonuclease
MADVAEKRMTVAEFLTWNDGTDTRYELIDGRPVAMAPVAPSHSVIVVNLGHALRSRPKAPCYAGSEAGVEHPGRDDTFYEADVVVSCTPVAPGIPAIPDPVVVIEVLSPSTIEHDRGRKAYDYVASRRFRKSCWWRASSVMSRFGAAAAPSGKSRI